MISQTRIISYIQRRAEDGGGERGAYELAPLPITDHKKIYVAMPAAAREGGGGGGRL